MSEFNGFSDAAKLYAKNLAIVTAMKEVFEQEITRYLDVLVEAVRDQLDTSYFRDEVKTSYRYWWIGKEDESSDKYTRIWFPARMPEILTSRVLRLHIQAPPTNTERVTMVKQLLARQGLDFLKSSKTPYAHADAIIKCEEADMIESPAANVATLLQELACIDGMC
ncbi:MAG: hypothetical protein H6822_25780 [Planctomycetaceae bacterium]|nr:hypothetical protein [Planctomycetaceae bacterium]